MIESILTVPPRMADYLNRPAGAALRERLAWPRGSSVFVTADPAGRKLGSGGGTVHALWQAWQVSGEPDLDTWLRASQKMILHAGGQSRRLPAYAAVGKAFLPLPSLDAFPAQRFDQVLCDFQVPAYAETLAEAGAQAVAMVASGDVWLDFNSLEIPPVTADIVGIGMRVSPEQASHFGVFFVARNGRGAEREVAFFLQKPEAEVVRGHLREYDCFVDTGMWLLSARAVRFLFRQCGATGDGHFGPETTGLPSYLDLYTDVGAQLGGLPEGLRSGVIPLEKAAFHHLGSSRQLFESVYEIDQAAGSSRKNFLCATAATCCTNLSRRPLWADGVNAPIEAHGANVVSGIPAGAGRIRLPEYLCVEMAPVGPARFCLRPYHLDDSGRGASDSEGRICGQPAGAWLAQRGMPVTTEDVFSLPLYPLLEDGESVQPWIDWFVSKEPDPGRSEAYRERECLAATEIADAVDLERYFALRRDGYAAVLRELFQAEGASPFSFDQDFSAIAAFILRCAPELKEEIQARRETIAASLYAIEHRTRFRVFLERLGVEVPEASAFEMLRDRILTNREAQSAITGLSLKPDQIVWARSPVRMDLAGGWTDTPPFCLERGGAVLNVAVTLNGQPPVQVFVRPTRERVIVIKSIDLGRSETVRTYDDIASFRDPQMGFSLVKAALALVGFHPDFVNGPAAPSLAAQLEQIGSGVELTLLCAVPKGSGLGTSSILAATLLGALSRTFGLGWDGVGLYRQVLALEQLLTTGGGWQDQAGALFPGLKLIETVPGPDQIPAVRYLPSHLKFGQMANRTMLLYYTGITRLAKNILAEIVSDMFLGKQETRMLLELIRRNAFAGYDAVQLNDPARIAATIDRSWRFNRTLDAGTTTPEIDAMLALCGDDLRAAKLLGAGGGGYLLLCAKDEAAGLRLRRTLEQHPPNAGARFVDLEVAERGLEVTVS